jgi:hypothetical protein
MASVEEAEKKAAALIGDDKATADQLIVSMKELLSAKTPWYYSITHTLGKIDPLSGPDKWDGYEKQIATYTTYVNEIKSGKRKIKSGKDGWPKVVQLGKSLLKSILNEDAVTPLTLPKEVITFAKDTVFEAGTGIKDLAVGAATAAADAAKKALTPEPTTIAGVVAVILLGVAVATRKTRI